MLGGAAVDDGGTDDLGRSRARASETMDPECAICGLDVQENRATVTVEWREERPGEYVLHERCARSVVGGWSEP